MARHWHNALLLALALTVPAVLAIGISTFSFGVGLALFTWNRGVDVPWKIILLIVAGGWVPLAVWYTGTWIHDRIESRMRARGFPLRGSRSEGNGEGESS